MNKTVIVTGGARGIGRAIVDRLLCDGYLVHVIDYAQDGVEKLVSEVDERPLQNSSTPEIDSFFLKRTQSSSSILTHIASSLIRAPEKKIAKSQMHRSFATASRLSVSVLDLSDRDQVAAFCDGWDRELYAIVNNAGVVDVELLDEEKGIWDRILNTNLHGPYFLTKGLLKHVQDNGRIVNIASQLGREGRAGYSAYCASKFGLIGLTKTWAYELGGRGITVNAVCPGWVRTDMAEGDLRRMADEMGVSRDEWYERICGQLELKRFTEPHEIAGLVFYLLSRDAAGITGRDWLLNVVWNQD